MGLLTYPRNPTLELEPHEGSDQYMTKSKKKKEWSKEELFVRWANSCQGRSASNGDPAI